MEVGAGAEADARRGPVVAGLVLAAGAGRRMGGPKALLRLAPAGRTMVEEAIAALVEGGCEPVIAVVGAAAERVGALADASGAVVVVEPGWAEGMGASLRAGLAAADAVGCEALLVDLVDLPDVGRDVVRRLVSAAGDEPAASLVRAAYGGVPGHPVLIGRDHWAGVAAVAEGDSGARRYLADHDARTVECGDIGSGRDLDRPADIWRAEPLTGRP